MHGQQAKKRALLILAACLKMARWPVRPIARVDVHILCWSLESSTVQNLNSPRPSLSNKSPCGEGPKNQR